MYTVLIADDEPNTRRGLSLFVDWAALDCEIVAEVEDGIAAQDYISTHPVDIVITDIRMPGIDGLQLAKYIFETHPETCVILLTAYADFSYAQSAIRYNVVDFVTKIDPAAKISDAVIKAKGNLSQRHTLSGEVQQLQSRLTALQSELQEGFICDVLNHEFADWEIIQKKACELGINLQQYILILCRFYPSWETSGNNMIQISALQRFFTQAFCDNHCISVCIDNNTLAILLMSEGSDKSLPNYSVIEDTCAEGLELSSQFTQVLLRIGVSSVHKSIQEILQAYDETEKALTVAFNNLKSNLCFFDKVRFDPCKPASLDLYYPALEAAISENDTDGALDIVWKFISELQHSGETAVQMILSCSTLITRLASLVTGATGGADNAGLEETAQQLRCSRSMAELETSVEALVRQTIFALHADAGRDNFVVRKIREYIQSNYHRSDITLQSIANHVYLNSSYMGRLYKKVTGESLVHSIHRLRMEKAKILLNDPSYKINQIASMIGVEDSSYFTSLFTKYEGISPTEYRNRDQKR